MVGLFILLKELKMRYQNRFSEQKRLTKDSRDKKISGVCAGLADYYDMPTFLIRILAVVALFCFTSITFVLYVLASIFMPNRY